MTTFRHKWHGTESQWNGQDVQRCAHCGTERTRDTSTASLYFFRRGRALAPRGRPMKEDWEAFISGVIPKCAGPEVSHD